MVRPARPCPVTPCAGCHGNTWAGLSPNSRRGGRRDASPGAGSGAAATGGARPALGQDTRWCSPAGCWSPWPRLRTGLTREAPGVICQAGSSTIGRATGEIRPLLAGRGFAVPQRPGLRLRALAGVFACAEGRKRHTAHRRRRNPGRRQDYAETHCAIAGLVSDRAAKRAARHRPSTELVPAFPTDGPGGLN